MEFANNLHVHFLFHFIIHTRAIKGGGKEVKKKKNMGVPKFKNLQLKGGAGHFRPPPPVHTSVISPVW